MVRLPVLNGDKILEALLLLVLLGLVVVPLVVMFTVGLGIADGDLAAPWRKMADDQNFLQVAINTLLLACAVTVASVVVGVLVALAIERTDFRASGTVEKLLIVPILVSPLVGAVAWVTLARPRTGLLNIGWKTLTSSSDPLFSIYSFFGIALVIALHLVPYVFVTVRNALRNVDGAMEEAAEIVGSTTLRTWALVTVPLVRPAILSSAVLVFVLTIETFSVVGLLGGPAGFVTFPFNIYLAVNLPPGDWDYAAFQGALLIVLTMLLMLGYWKLVGDTTKYNTVGAKAHRIAGNAKGWIAVTLAIIVWVYITIAVIAPGLALVLQSLLAFNTSDFSQMIFTWENWIRVIQSATFVNAVSNTAIVGGCAATLAVLISLLASHLNVFEKQRHFDILSSISLAFPGIVLGIALIYVYSGTLVYGTLLILILAYTTQFLPLTTRALSGPMMQLDKGLDEAGKVLGASLLSRAIFLTGAIIRPAVLGAWLLAFSRGIRELNLSIFLYTPATIVIPVMIWNYMEQGTYGLAAALSLIQVVALLLIVILTEWLGGRAIDE